MSKGKKRMAWLSEHDQEAYARIVKERSLMEPKTPAFPLNLIIGGEKPECTEPDCYGVILLGRHPETFRLDPFAKCMICARPYAVEGIEDANERSDIAFAEQREEDVVLNIDNCSNNIPECLHCGVTITPENDSGWEGFVPPDGTTSQAICKECEAKQYKGPVMKEGAKPETLN
jgi:hypothetical protein